MAEETKNPEEGLKTKEEASQSAAAQEGMSLDEINNLVSFCENDDEKRRLLIEMLTNIQDDLGVQLPSNISARRPVFTTLVSLSKAFAALGNIKEQEDCLQAALNHFPMPASYASDEDKKDLSFIVDAMLDLAKICTASQDFKGTREYLEGAREIQEKLHGQDSQAVAATLIALADACQSGLEGYLDRRRDYLERALAIQQQHREGNDPLIISLLEKLGNIFNIFEKFNEARPYLESAYALQHERYQLEEEQRGLEKGAYQLDDLQLASICTNLGKAYVGFGQIDQAVEKLECALSLLGRDYHENRALISTTLQELDEAYSLLMAGAESERNSLDEETKRTMEEQVLNHLEQALEGRKRRYGPNHLLVAFALRNLGRFHGLARKDSHKQVMLLEEALAIQRGSDVPDQKEEQSYTLIDLAEAYGRLGDIDKKKECFQLAEALFAIQPPTQQPRGGHAASALYNSEEDSKEQEMVSLPMVTRPLAPIAPGSATTRHSFSAGRALVARNLLADLTEDQEDQEDQDTFTLKEILGIRNRRGLDAEKEWEKEEERLLQMAIQASLEGMQGGPH